MLISIFIQNSFKVTNQIKLILKCLFMSYTTPHKISENRGEKTLNGSQSLNCIKPRLASFQFSHFSIRRLPKALVLFLLASFEARGGVVHTPLGALAMYCVPPASLILFRVHFLFVKGNSVTQQFTMSS